MPLLAELIHNLYESKYDKFFIALGTRSSHCAGSYLSLITHAKSANQSATLEQTFLLPSRILAPHTRFYVREMRIIAYSQLLESYRSLTLDSLARSFGVSIDFVDRCVYYLAFCCRRLSLFCSVLIGSGLIDFSVSSPGSSHRADYTARLTKYTGSWRQIVLRSRTRSTIPSSSRVMFY